MMRRLPAIAICLVFAATACKKKEGDKKPETKPETTPETKPPSSEPPEPAIKTEEVTYKSGDTELKGFLAYPAKTDGPVPGVLVVHEWWGHNDYVRNRAKMLAELGYAALAVDMYGDGKNTEHPEDAEKFMKEVTSNMDEGVKRFEAGYKLLADHPSTDPQKIAAIGYCFGGAVVLHMARIGLDLDAVAAFHAGGLGTKTPAKKGQVKAVVMVANGKADPFVSPESIEGFKKEMADAGVDLRWFEYEGAKHGFTNPAADTKKMDALGYNEAADKASWAELKKVLEEVFAK